MGFFGAIGKAFGAVGKVALGVVKTGVNVAGNVAGIGTIFPPSGGAQQAQMQSIPQQPPVPQTGGVVVASSPSLLDVVKYSLSGVGNFLFGNTHPQVDVNVGTGGRVADMPGTGSPLPSWLLPVGLIGGAILLFSSMGGRRR